MRASGSHVVQGRERESELGMKRRVVELVSPQASWATPRGASGKCGVNDLEVSSQTVRTGAVTETQGLRPGGVQRQPGRAKKPGHTQEHHGDARSAPEPQSLWQSALSADARRSKSKTSQKAKRVLGRRIGRDQELRNECPGMRSAFMGERFSSLKACLDFCLLAKPFKVLSMF